MGAPPFLPEAAAGRLMRHVKTQNCRSSQARDNDDVDDDHGVALRGEPFGPGIKSVVCGRAALVGIRSN